MTLPFSRRRRERAALAGGCPDTGETIKEILERVRPARYHGTAIRAAGPAWDGTAWGGASDTGLPGGAAWGPPPAAPEATP